MRLLGAILLALIPLPLAYQARAQVQTTPNQPVVAVLHLSLTPRHTENLNAVDIRGLPHQTATLHNPHTNADETYSGVPLSDLLTRYGAPLGEKLRGKALAEYIVATGTDGYKAVLALAEIDPSFHSGDVLIADTQDGKPLDDKTGPFRLVVTGDKRPARSVRNLVSIEVRSAE